ncbi:MAG: sulfite exporter TauE/SafE family protein [Planctomycetota bacterium]
MQTDLLPMIGAVLVAAIVGSLHCAGMCGAFVALAVGLDRQVSRTRLLAAYNGGRLATYATIGLAAGTIGQLFDAGGTAVGLQRGAAWLAAATMIVMGAVALARATGWRAPAIPVPAFCQRAFAAVARWSATLTPTRRALAIGLATGLLPCGWLYAFALLAAGTGHALTGALVMAAFWLGTTPVLVGIGAGVRMIAGPIGRHAPAAMATVIIIMGVLLAADRAALDPARFVGMTASAALASNDEPLPCCAESSKP